MAPPVRVAIAGYGFIADYHARAARAVDGAELVVVGGRNEEKLTEFAKRHDIERVETDLDALAEGPDVDLLVNALPNAFHAPLSLTALRAGKHVLVEKPMAMSAEEARAMSQAARDNDRRLLVGHMWRFDREANWLAEQVAAGEIGKIVKTKSYGIHVNWGPTGWFVDPDLAGGGALIDMGVHAIDTTRYLIGDPDPVRVFASIDTAYGDYEVDDIGVLQIEWSSGAVSIVECGWWNPYMDGPEASTQLFGTDGYARLFPTTVTRVRDGEPELVEKSFPTREEHCDQHMFTGQMQAMVDAIREGTTPEAGPSVGEAVMKICDSAYKSARDRQAVTI